MEGDGVPEGMGNLVFDFQAGHEEEGLSIQEMPKRFLNVPVVFLAAREVLTIYPSFVQVGSRFPEFLDGGSWDLWTWMRQRNLSARTPGAWSPGWRRSSAGRW